MTRLHKALLLLGLVAVPAAAHTYVAGEGSACFTSGTSTFRMATAGEPDYTVRFADEQARPDLRMQIVESAAEADFALIDDVTGIEGNACKGPMPVKTIRIDPAASEPDVTVSLSAEAAAPHYRIYVQSARFSHQDAAALLAVMTKVQPRYRLVGQR
jgi:hypothetical protein